MDCQLVDIDERDPSETIQIFCPACEKHTFNISIGTIQLMRGIMIKCPECGGQIKIYINPAGIFCIE